MTLIINKIKRLILVTELILVLFFIILQAPRVQAADTTTVNLYSTEDTYVDQTNPGTNYGSDAQMINGHTTTSDYKEAFIKFDFSSIPSKSQIESAYLYLYLVPGADCAAGQSPYINSVDSAWSENSLTWSNRSMSYGGTNGYLNMNCGSGYILSDLTYSVQQMVDGVSTNYGFRLGAGIQAGWTRSFYTRNEAGTDKDPYLAVVYSASDDHTAPIITGLAVDAYENEADVSWDTYNEYSSGEVRWATSADALGSNYQSTSSSGYVDSHYISITGLASGTQYFIRVVSVDVHGNESSQDTTTTTLAVPTSTPENTPTPTEEPAIAEEPVLVTVEQPTPKSQTPTVLPTKSSVFSPTPVPEDDELEPSPTIEPNASPTGILIAQLSPTSTPTVSEEKSGSVLGYVLGGVVVLVVAGIGTVIYLRKTGKDTALRAFLARLTRKPPLDNVE